MALVRRYNYLPSIAELAKVAGIIILNLPPPSQPGVAQYGKALIVGETEDGAYNTPTDLLESTDQANKFGLFGFQYGALRYQYACALASGGSEPWNGNLYLHSKGRKFAAMAICRVDTSVGQLAFTPRAFLDSTVAPTFNITPGQTFIFTKDGGGPTTATFAGTAASVTASAGTYNSFTGGEQLQFALDNGSLVTVTFSAGDTSLAAIISRISTTFGQTIATNSSGQLKITSLTFGTGSKVAVTASAVATTLGLSSTPATGTGDAANLAAMTLAELATKLSTLVVKLSPAGLLRLVSATAGTGTLSIGAGTANAALGYVSGQAATAALATLTTIGAGTRASDGTTVVVTTQSTDIAKGSTATTLLKVRPAVDDGSYLGASGGTVTTLIDQPGAFEWTVSNPSALTAALTASQLDSAYLTAIAATLGPGSDITKKITVIVSARTSNAIRTALVQNEITASANGHYQRRAVICPPNGTAAATIIGNAAPGVGVYRDKNTSYAAGGVQSIVQELIDGGYSVTGVMTRHPDMMLASRISALPPGLNPGQIPEDPTLRFDPSVDFAPEPVAIGWDVPMYAAFNAAGVCAIEFDSDVGIAFEEGINTDITLTDTGQAVLEGFVGDSLTGIGKIQAKRQATTQRIEFIEDQINRYLATLVPNQVASFSVSVTTKNLPPGFVRYDVNVDPTGNLRDIIFALHVGPNAVELVNQSGG